MVVAQLVERLLPTPEIHGSNPDIGKILSTNCTIEKMKIKKRPILIKEENAHEDTHFLIQNHTWEILVRVLAFLSFLCELGQAELVG